MTKREITLSLTEAEYNFILDAARAADLTPHRFIRKAVRIHAAQYGFLLPEETIKLAPSPRKSLVKSGGGRPRKELSHPMERHVPAGDFNHLCGWCERHFRTDIDWSKYCSLICETRAQNKRMYERRKQKNK